MKKRHLPYWMHRRESCPDCGWIPEQRKEIEFEKDIFEKKYFICPRCGANYGMNDFLNENYFKYNKQANLEEENE